jgi:hypothetical protein
MPHHVLAEENRSASTRCGRPHRNAPLSYRLRRLVRRIHLRVSCEPTGASGSPRTARERLANTVRHPQRCHIRNHSWVFTSADGY